MTPPINIPGYLIERQLGRGGMAAVYLATQESLLRKVALKIMNPALASDRSCCERFLKEGRIIAELIHPNIVTVHDVGMAGSLYYLAMGYQMVLGQMPGDEELNDYMAHNIEQNFGFIRESWPEQPYYMVFYRDEKEIVVALNKTEAEAKRFAVDIVSDRVGAVGNWDEVMELEETERSFRIDLMQMTSGKIVSVWAFSTETL